jgi:two-component system response regulator FixJ
MTRILIADDDSGACETLADILSGQGYEVRTAESSQAALEAAQGEHYDVALIDQRMPAMEGLTVASELIRTRACDEVFMITAYAEPGFAKRAHAKGVRHVFVKPIDIPHVLQMIGRTSGGRALSQPADFQPDAKSPPLGLTRRELQVLALIAQGKHNRKIAAELTLSPRTVERHVEKILARLEVPGRAAAAAFAIRHRLV